MERPNYIVDNLNRPAKVIYPNGKTISYIYDGAENLSKIIDSALGSITYQYDLLDRIIKVIYPNGKVISYAYDPVGNRIRTTYPNGEVVYYNYNKNNWLSEVIAGNKKTCFEYDKAGRLIKKTLPNGIIVAYTYNSAGRLIRLVTTNANNSTLFDFSYGIDAVGNYLEVNKNSGDSIKKTHFTYDPLYRLTKVKYPDGNKTKYKYDHMGNRLSMKASFISNNNKLSSYLGMALGNLEILWNKARYTYDSENRLVKGNDIEFKYDDIGNLVERRTGNKITRFEYDYENRLVKIEYPDGTYNQYTYDALGRRISKRYPDGKTVFYLYDGHNLIQEVIDKGHVIASYIYDLGIDHSISMTRNGKTYYYLYDHLGSVIALTDESGNIVVKYEYDTWGNVIKENGDIPNPFRFTGREWDEESKLYYYRARYYDPIIGRFISKDTIESNPLNAQSLNKYVYVDNNPQTNVDPFGLISATLSKFLRNSPSPPRFSVPQTPSMWQLWLQQGPFKIHTPLQGVDNFLSSLGSQLLKDGGSAMSPMISGLSKAVKLTNFIPSFFNPDPVDAFTSAVHTGTSIAGGLFGASQGAQWGAVAGFAVGNFPGAFVGSVLGGALGGMVGGQAFTHLGRFIAHSIETSGQNILNAIQSHVGGVLFDKSAEISTDLEEITGAYWDDKLGQIVLVGKKNENREELYVPRMDKDHLAVAMRAVFSGDNLGVSIDPPPGHLESGRFPSDGTKMSVRYLGSTKNTLFGAIMFEADRLLKNLSMGIDNETRKEISSNVSGFQNELDLSLQHGSERKSAWHRMWFVIEDMRLEMVVKEAADRNALTFGKATLKVKAEYISKTNEKNPGVDPIAEHFAKHFTIHYDEFAKEFPVLERLRELAKISAIVKWLKNSGKPIDLSFLNTHEFIEVPTPEDTVGITASKSKRWQEGNITHTQTYSLYGGVDFDFKYQAVRDDEEALTLKNAVQKSKPCEATLSWDFNFKGKPQRALVFPVGKTNGNYTTVHTDFTVPISDRIKLELARCYDSFNLKTSIFGYGWNLKIPYEIFIINKQKTNSPILIINKLKGKSYKHILVEDKQDYFLVNEEREEGDKTSFTYDPQKSIKRNADSGFTYKEDEFTCHFDSQGKMTSMVDKNNKGLNYTYEGNRVVRISDSYENIIRLIYDQKGRVKQAICPGQIMISYQYSPSGDLIGVSENGVNVKSYVYDAYLRLIKAMDAKEKAILRNSYDSLGRVIRKRQDTIVDPEGNQIIKTYDDTYRLIKEEDRKGNTIFYEYDKQNNLSKTNLTDKQRRTTVFEYNKDERVKRIINPLKHSVDISYDIVGNITSFVDTNKNITSLKYDENGNLLVVQDAIGNQWKQEFDHLSRFKGIVDSLGNKVEFEYIGNDNKLKSVTSSEGIMQYQYDKKGLLTKYIDPNGNSIEFIYDLKGNMIEVKDALDRKWSL